jgi:hypothetical protein
VCFDAGNDEQPLSGSNLWFSPALFRYKIPEYAIEENSLCQIQQLPSSPPSYFSSISIPHTFLFTKSVTMVQYTQRTNSGMSGLPTEEAVADTKARTPIPDRIKNAIVIVIGEFCGTFMFLLLSFIGAETALITNNPSDPSAELEPFSLMYIAASFGTALAVNVWIFYRVSGGMFNPAVSDTRTEVLF